MRSFISSLRNTAFFSLLVFIGGSLSIFSMASASESAQAKEPGFKLIRVADLEKMLSADKERVFIFDANNKSTREKQGLIPGAKTLDDSSEYDAQATLPADKTARLVFYCANEECMASHSAAKVAVAAGFKDVSVLADGIFGWKKSGKKTVKFKAG